VSQERLTTVVNKAPLILFGLDRNGVFTFSEGKALEQLGLKPNEVVGRSVYEVYADLPQILENVSRALKGEELTSVVEARERVYETWYAPLRDINGEIQGVIGVANDITERSLAEKALRQSEEQLLHSQKMEAMGRLAGGVAHDFNNLLTVILGHCDFLQRRLESNDAVQRDIDLIKSTSNRAVSLTRQLLAFSRRQVQQPKIIDLNAVVSDMERMVRRLIGEDIDLVFVPGEKLGLVKADLGQVEQVILNLVVNARDAMPQGGRLSIHTENVELDDTYLQKHMAAKPGRYVMLAVTDTGTGIDKDVIPHIFEPFFTTKEKGRGTGLGLSTVYGIVKQSQGNVWVYSEQNRGTAFKVYLPRCDGAKLQKETAQVAVDTVAGSETILLMEDEEAVRALAREILLMYGYTVLEAVTPEEAFLVCKQHEGKIHLLLSDVIMPHMNGPELAECLRATRPDMTVLFMSGYTGDTIFSQGAIDVGTPFLQKPFTVDSLARKVRQVLDEAEQAEKGSPGNKSPSG
jgi:PAS domain S-box-containing protein